MSLQVNLLDRRNLWLPALAFLLLNVAALLVYQFRFASRSVGLEERLAQREEQLAKVRVEHERSVALAERAKANRLALDEVYRDRFSTRSRRLTQVTEEIKELARRAGLEPRAFSYPEEEIAEHGLIERKVQFQVEGTYPALRTFINFLELSPSFLTLEEIAVNQAAGSGGALLGLDMTLSTLFVQEEALPEDRTTLAQPAAAGEEAR
jgi:Tfp pilus assembly protein PilO